MTTLTQTITEIPSLDDNDTILKIVIDSNRKVWQQIYLYAYEAYDGFPRYTVLAYGRNNSFLVHTFEDYPEALAEFANITKAGE